jgi:hypothetical protein
MSRIIIIISGNHPFKMTYARRELRELIEHYCRIKKEKYPELDFEIK